MDIKTIDLVQEVSNIANQLLESSWDLTHSEAIAAATKIQQSRVLEDAFMVNQGDCVPRALEKIAMELSK